MSEPPEQTPRDIGGVLNEHREALHAVPGVIATGIGLGGRQRRTLVIQIFVASDHDVPEAEDYAGSVLQDIAPFEVMIGGEVSAS